MFGNKKMGIDSLNKSLKNEIDFIMTNRPKTFKNVSIINNLNFDSDHRMVWAIITGQNVKIKRSFVYPSNAITCTGYSLSLVNNLKSIMNTNTFEKTTVQEKYNTTIKCLKTETKRINNNSKKCISIRTRELLNERKELL